MTTSEKDAQPQSRGELTAKAIRQAIVRIEQGRPKVVQPGRKLSIQSVAEEAGVSRATIHNNHPGLADQIRESANKAVRGQRDQKNAELKELRAKYTALRQELSRCRELNQDMASELATLTVENEHLRAIAGSSKVAVFPSNRIKP